MIAGWRLAVLLAVGATPTPEPSPGWEFYKEDHYTGADYLALDPSGRYELIGREHMGVWVLERGGWTRNDDVLSFSPEGSKLEPYRGTRVEYGCEVFLVWTSDKAAGIVVPADEVKADLAKEKGYPPYVFFRVGEELFRKETGVTYPFRFLPEMNRPQNGGQTKRP